MATEVGYNGITLRNVLTRMFDEEIVYDESGADPACHKFRMRFSGIVHDSPNQDAPTGVYPFSVGSNTTQIEIAIRRALLEPRHILSVVVGGETLLIVNPERPDTGMMPSYQYDCDNGPKPISVNVVHIAGSKSFRVDFVIEASVVDCASIDNASGVLGNRWSASDDIDENWYTTRTITGTLRTKSVYLNPQAFRSLCIPPLQRGFRRQRIDCTTSPDGLTLRYTVVDREVHASCPLPGTTWEATHTISAMPDTDGGVLLGDFNIRLTGPKGVDKASLIALAAIIIQQKLSLREDNGTEVTFLEGRIVDFMHENTIEMHARVMFARSFVGSGDGAMRKFAFNTLGFGLTLDKMPEPLAEYDAELSWVPPNYGTATTTGLFIAYLQSPCNSAHGIPQAADGTPENDDSQSGSGDSAHNPSVTTRTGEIEKDPEIDANYSQENATAIYSCYRIDVEYHRNGRKAALPIANSGAEPDQPTCAVVMLARPTVKRVVKIEAERMGEWPALPKFEETSEIGSLKLHLLDSVIVPKSPKLVADGKTKLYSIDATYTFACSRPPQPGVEMQVGSLPWDTSTTDENYLPDNGSDGIIK